MKEQTTDEMIKKRLRELAGRAYAEGRFCFSQFLDMQALSCYHTMQYEPEFVNSTLFGGYPEAERQMLRFGDAELGYEEEFPITCLRIEPVAMKFAEALSHRDFLGAVLGLGLERSLIGDILVREKSAHLFCHQSIAEYICAELKSVRRTTVKVSVADMLPEEFAPKLQEEHIQTASARADVVIAAVYKLSRSEALELFRAKRVLIDGRFTENNSRLLNPDEIVSVRGFGRFVFVGLEGISKKGKQKLKVLRYVD